MPANHVSVENCPEHETQVGFEYPEFEIPEDIKEEIELYTTKLLKDKMCEFVRRMVIFLVDQPNPVVALKALLVKCETDFESLQDADSMTKVAKTLNVSKQMFHYNTKTIQKKYEEHRKEQEKLKAENPFFS